MVQQVLYFHHAKYIKILTESKNNHTNATNLLAGIAGEQTEDFAMHAGIG